MPLAFLDDVVAVVAAEVGEPSLSDDGFAVCGGGFEVALGNPAGDGLPAVAEELFKSLSFFLNIHFCVLRYVYLPTDVSGSRTTYHKGKEKSSEFKKTY